MLPSVISCFHLSGQAIYFFLQYSTVKAEMQVFDLLFISFFQKIFDFKRISVFNEPWAWGNLCVFDLKLTLYRRCGAEDQFMKPLLQQKSTSLLSHISTVFWKQVLPCCSLTFIEALLEVALLAILYIHTHHMCGRQRSGCCGSNSSFCGHYDVIWLFPPWKLSALESIVPGIVLTRP